MPRHVESLRSLPRGLCERRCSCGPPRANMGIDIGIGTPGDEPRADLRCLVAEFLLLRRVLAGPAFLVGSLDLDQVPAIAEPREEVGRPVRGDEPDTQSCR